MSGFNSSVETIAAVSPSINDTNSWINKTITDIHLYWSAIFNVPHCEIFTVISHAYFQLANMFFLLSYFASYGKCGILYLRCMLLIGCVFFGIWSYEVMCKLDALIWNLMFIVLNAIHIVILMVKQWPVRFGKEVEDVSKLPITLSNTIPRLAYSRENGRFPVVTRKRI